MSRTTWETFMRNTLIALFLLLPTLALAGPKELAGTWQIQLSAEETAKIEVMIKEAQKAEGDGLAKAMVKAMLAVAEMKMTFTDDTLTMNAGEMSEVSNYTAAGDNGAWTLTTTNSDGETKVFEAKIVDGFLVLVNDKQSQKFRKLP